jgi:hypothetical protein
MQIPPDVVPALLILLGTPALAKVNQKLVDALKKFQTFANSSPAVKRSVALIGSTVLSWVSTVLGVKLSGTDVTTLGVNDVLVVVVALFSWLSSMYFHDTKPATPTT